jgi:glutamyl-Q tRNA(Asp) synthetase
VAVFLFVNAYPAFMQVTCRGRFAPSPSGPLHFGSLVAALGSCLEARSRQGEWLLRMEDLDPPREEPGAADTILRTLEAFGFAWDGEVLYQSRRQEAYHAAAEELIARGEAYPCACSRREVAAAGLKGIDGPRYPGTCRNGIRNGRTARAVRVRVDDDPLRLHDRICGEISQHLARDSGDFIIRRADGLFAYQLAVVVDDAFQGITDVVRGSDLLSSTPRQIHLQRLLSLPSPAYAHLPLALGSDGKKLSKQSHARPVPDNGPLASLTAALQFLNQPLPPEPPVSLQAFWEWAIAHWDLTAI